MNRGGGGATTTTAITTNQRPIERPLLRGESR